MAVKLVVLYPQPKDSTITAVFGKPACGLSDRTGCSAPEPKNRLACSASGFEYGVGIALRNVLDTRPSGANIRTKLVVSPVLNGYLGVLGQPGSGPIMRVTMILSGWKEIAHYLRCSVRTAQRWQSIGLRIKHLHPGHRAPVFADYEEIDSWMRGGSFWRKKDMDTLANVTRSRELRAQVQQSMASLRHTLDRLRKTLDPLRAKIH